MQQRGMPRGREKELRRPESAWFRARVICAQEEEVVSAREVGAESRRSICVMGGGEKGRFCRAQLETYMQSCHLDLAGRGETLSTVNEVKAADNEA